MEKKTTVLRTICIFISGALKTAPSQAIEIIRNLYHFDLFVKNSERDLLNLPLQREK